MKDTTKYTTFAPIYRRSRLGLIFIAGVAVGLGAFYLFEPRSRSRRHALIRDKASSLAHRYTALGAKLARHLRNRVQGVLSIAANLIRAEGIESDPRIEARVRTALGRVTHQAHAVSVSVDQGKVSLRGSLAPHEAGVVIRATEQIRGVKKVENLITAPVEVGQSPIQ